MLFLDVNLGGGKIKRLIIKDGDDSMQIAAQFCRENSKLCNSFFRFKSEKGEEAQKCDSETTSRCPDQDQGGGERLLNSLNY